MADVSSTASVIVALLAPYLAASASGAATQVLRHDRGWSLAAALWERLTEESKFSRLIADAASDLQSHPDDDDARAALRLQLRKVMDADPRVADELFHIVESAGSDEGTSMGVSGRTATINVNVSGDLIIGGPTSR